MLGLLSEKNGKQNKNIKINSYIIWSFSRGAIIMKAFSHQCHMHLIKKVQSIESTDSMHIEMQLYLLNQIFRELPQCAPPARTSEAFSHIGVNVMHLLEVLQSLISAMCRGVSQGDDSKLGK